MKRWINSIYLLINDQLNTMSSWNGKVHLQGYVLCLLAVFAFMPVANAVNGPGGAMLDVGSVWTSNTYTSNASGGSQYGTNKDRLIFESESSPSYTWGASSDGKMQGIVIAPDVILAFSGTSTTTAGTTVEGSGISGINVKVNFDSENGVTTINNCSPTSGCVITSDKVGGSPIVGLSNQTVLTYITRNISLKFMIYAGPKAKSGTYQTPQLRVVDGRTEWDVMIPESTINVMSLDCSIVAPPEIKFGQIDVSTLPSNDEVLAVSTGNLVVNCSGAAGYSFPATIAVRGAQGRYSNTLELNLDTGKPAPAEIRGFIGPGTPGSGACSGGGASWIQFASNGKVNPIEELSVGVNNIPYNFTVCATGLNTNTGVAKAQATIDVNWD